MCNKFQNFTPKPNPTPFTSISKRQIQGTIKSIHKKKYGSHPKPNTKTTGSSPSGSLCIKTSLHLQISPTKIWDSKPILEKNKNKKEKKNEFINKSFGRSSYRRRRGGSQGSRNLPVESCLKIRPSLRQKPCPVYFSGQEAFLRRAFRQPPPTVRGISENGDVP